LSLIGSGADTESAAESKEERSESSLGARLFRASTGKGHFSFFL